MKTRKIEKNIRYCEDNDTYYVQFNFADRSHLRGFPTVEDARAYRDVINAAKLEVKIKEDLALIYKREDELIKKIKPYPYNAFEIVGFRADEVELSFVNNFDDLLAKACGDKEVICIRMYFKREGTLESIGKILDISKERVRQIINKGMKKVASYIFEQRLNNKQN